MAGGNLRNIPIPAIGNGQPRPDEHNPPPQLRRLPQPGASRCRHGLQRLSLLGECKCDLLGFCVQQTTCRRSQFPIQPTLPTLRISKCTPSMPPCRYLPSNAESCPLYEDPFSQQVSYHGIEDLQNHQPSDWSIACCDTTHALRHVSEELFGSFSTHMTPVAMISRHREHA